jgi:hypothetical protein
VRIRSKSAVTRNQATPDIIDKMAESKSRDLRARHDPATIPPLAARTRPEAERRGGAARPQEAHDPVLREGQPRWPPCRDPEIHPSRLLRTVGTESATSTVFRRADRTTMPKRTDIQSILIVGAGPIIIGQACEFDYSGTQACKALKAEGYRIILVNSNPATIMTDPDLADATYVEPITPEVVAKIIAKERPDAILPTMGGQTALNCALVLAQNGRSGRIRRGDDRRDGRGHRQGRRPRAFPRSDGRSDLETPRGETLKGSLRDKLDPDGKPILDRRATRSVNSRRRVWPRR